MYMHKGTSIKQPVSQQSSLPPPHLFADEITALLMSIASNKMPISTLTGLYNTAFRSTSGQPQVSAEQLQEAMRKLTNVKVHACLCLVEKYLKGG